MNQLQEKKERMNSIKESLNSRYKVVKISLNGLNLMKGKLDLINFFEKFFKDIDFVLPEKFPFKIFDLSAIGKEITRVTESDLCFKAIEDIIEFLKKAQSDEFSNENLNGEFFLRIKEIMNKFILKDGYNNKKVIINFIKEYNKNNDGKIVDGYQNSKVWLFIKGIEQNKFDVLPINLDLTIFEDIDLCKLKKDVKVNGNNIINLKKTNEFMKDVQTILKDIKDIDNKLKNNKTFEGNKILSTEAFNKLNDEIKFIMENKKILLEDLQKKEYESDTNIIEKLVIECFIENYKLISKDEIKNHNIDPDRKEIISFLREKLNLSKIFTKKINPEISTPLDISKEFIMKEQFSEYLIKNQMIEKKDRDLFFEYIKLCKFIEKNNEK